MSKKKVYFNELINEIMETPRNRTIEIKQRLNNLVSRTKKLLKKRFPNGIQPLIEEKTELETKINGNETVNYRQVLEWETRISEIDNAFIHYENLNFIIKNPKYYIEHLDETRKESGIKESKKEKKSKSIRLSPTSINTTLNTTKKNNPKGGKKNKKNYRHTRRIN